MFINEVSKLNTNSKVVNLYGWVNAIRHHGGLLFIELRDNNSQIQLVTDSPGSFPDIKNEYLISISGKVVLRDKKNINRDHDYGNKEIILKHIDIISTSKVLPFQISNDIEVDEQIRLKYRYLDLRRPEMKKNILLRSSVFKSIRQSMIKQNIDEIDTPTLIKSTPEGARDFIVPSRKHKNKFYALPQSPQMYKQLFMISGFESYYQIAKCYRDEDSRKDRQPEFTQFDLEIPFSEPDDIQDVIESLVTSIFKECMGITIPMPFNRISYDESIIKYGTDKPDLRNPIQIHDISHIFADTKIKFIKKSLLSGDTVNAIYTDTIHSRKEVNEFNDTIKQLGSTGLGWFVVNNNKITSPLSKILSQIEKDAISNLVKGSGTVFFQVGDPYIVNRYMCTIFQSEVIDSDVFEFIWVDNFPYFEIENDHLLPSHHPFTAPVDASNFRDDPYNAKALHYDLVLNGVELGSGSKRIHEPKLQKEVLKKWGLSEVEISERFGWFIEALSYGTPPHAGFAIGLDRLISTMINAESIRDVIPFPKTQTGYDPLSDSPSDINPEILTDYNLMSTDES